MPGVTPRIVLFAFGAGLGVLVGWWLVVSVREPLIFFSVPLVSGVASGLLSARYGLRFWEAVRHAGWFLP